MWLVGKWRRPLEGATSSLLPLFHCPFVPIAMCRGCLINHCFRFGAMTGLPLVCGVKFWKTRLLAKRQTVVAILFIRNFHFPFLAVFGCWYFGGVRENCGRIEADVRRSGIYEEVLLIEPLTLKHDSLDIFVFCIANLNMANGAPTDTHSVHSDISSESRYREESHEQPL